jgi:hypothetical protein
MNGSNHSRSGEPSFPQLLQGLQKGLEILLSVARGPVAPVIGGGVHHSLRKRREPPVVISEIEPPALPPFVRGRKDGGDILRRPRLPQLEDASTSPHCRADPSPVGEAKSSAEKRMSPQVPVRVNPQISFTNRREDGSLRDGVRTEVVQLHPVDMQNRPHKTACQHSEPPLVKGDEAHDMPRRRGRGGPARRGHPLRLRVTGERAKQTLSNKGPQVIRRDGGERPRVTRWNNGHPVGHHQAEEVAAERTE